MSPLQKTLVAWIWTICLASAIAATLMVLHENSHPLAGSDRQDLWAVYSLPYLILAISAWVLRRRTAALGLLAFAVAVGGLFTTAACYQDMTNALYILEARRAGRLGAGGGPPLGILAAAAVYGMALIAMAASFGLIGRRAP